MSGDKLPRFACPVCRVEARPWSGAHIHCPDPSGDCTWIVCKCGSTFDIYTARHIPTSDPVAVLKDLYFAPIPPKDPA